VYSTDGSVPALTLVIGACYSEESLSALVDFAVRHNIHLVSDEVYALSVYRDVPGRPNFTSVLSVDLRKKGATNLVHVLYGFSKVLGF
jgi:aspartate/methionine/tyrosine aminotransferase